MTWGGPPTRGVSDRLKTPTNDITKHRAKNVI